MDPFVKTWSRHVDMPGYRGSYEPISPLRLRPTALAESPQTLAQIMAEEYGKLLNPTSGVGIGNRTMEHFYQIQADGLSVP
jgi:hypothetical protein